MNNATAPTTASWNIQEAIFLANAVEQAYLMYAGTIQQPNVPGFTVSTNNYINVYEELTSTFFGFVATGTLPGATSPCNILILRGTQTLDESMWDADWNTTPCLLNGNQYGNAAEGIYTFYTGSDIMDDTTLQSSLQSAITSLNTSLPLYVAGHSLGGAIAVLAALDLVANNLCTSPIVYTYAGLYVGDATFATEYTQNGISAFRLVNLADAFPNLDALLPGGESDSNGNYFYVHVGEEYNFLWDTGHLWDNHSLTAIYIATLTNYPQVIASCNPTYPMRVC